MSMSLRLIFWEPLPGIFIPLGSNIFAEITNDCCKNMPSSNATSNIFAGNLLNSVRNSPLLVYGHAKLNISYLNTFSFFFYSIHFLFFPSSLSISIFLFFPFPPPHYKILLYFLSFIFYEFSFFSP